MGKNFLKDEELTFKNPIPSLKGKFNDFMRSVKDAISQVDDTFGAYRLPEIDEIIDSLLEKKGEFYNKERSLFYYSDGETKEDKRKKLLELCHDCILFLKDEREMDNAEKDDDVDCEMDHEDFIVLELKKILMAPVQEQYCERDLSVYQIAKEKSLIKRTLNDVLKECEEDYDYSVLCDNMHKVISVIEKQISFKTINA